MSTLGRVLISFKQLDDERSDCTDIETVTVRTHQAEDIQQVDHYWVCLCTDIVCHIGVVLSQLSADLHNPFVGPGARPVIPSYLSHIHGNDSPVCLIKGSSRRTSYSTQDHDAVTSFSSCLFCKGTKISKQSIHIAPYIVSIDILLFSGSQKYYFFYNLFMFFWSRLPCKRRTTRTNNMSNK